MTFLPPLPDTLSDALLDEVHDLTLACLSGEAKLEDAMRLDELVCTSDAACKIYAQVIRDSYCLRRRTPTDDLHSDDFVGQANAGEFPAASVSGAGSAGLGFFGSVVHGTINFFSLETPRAYLVATVVIGLGLLIGSLTDMSRSVQSDQIANNSALQAAPSTAPTIERKTEYVGRITGMVNAKWSGRTVAAADMVFLGDRYALASGLMEITYDSGAKVILQGPCAYEVESRAGGFLSLGKLTARVEKNEERRTKNGELSASRSSFLIPHSYFAVRTPAATVTDLGTEFGVEVDKDGDTTSHVFRGLVEVRVNAEGNEMDAEGNETEKVACTLRENQSARVEKAGDSDGRRVIKVIPSNDHRAAFVRTMPKRTVKQFDLVDVVAGGDGYSGRRESGIQPRGNPSTELWRMDGDYLYHRVEGMPFVDGIFIPDGGRGPVQTDSAGHVFAEFPLTENITVARPIWAGHGVPTDKNSGVTVAVDVKLADVDYSAPGHGLLLVIANQGITFDLDAIRRANPGYGITRFSTVVANVDWQSPGSYFVDFWVLIDGKRCKRFRQMSALNGAVPMMVPFGPKDRFLTLAVTDGGDTTAGDYGVFGDPRLELMTIE